MILELILGGDDRISPVCKEIFVKTANQSDCSEKSPEAGMERKLVAPNSLFSPSSLLLKSENFCNLREMKLHFEIPA